MRKHSRRHRAFVERKVAQLMWGARVSREARRGAIVVAGPCGEVLRVDASSLDGRLVVVAPVPFKVKPDVLARTGPRWTQDDLRASGAKIMSDLRGKM